MLQRNDVLCRRNVEACIAQYPVMHCNRRELSRSIPTTELMNGQYIHREFQYNSCNYYLSEGISQNFIRFYTSFIISIHSMTINHTISECLTLILINDVFICGIIHTDYYEPSLFITPSILPLKFGSSIPTSTLTQSQPHHLSAYQTYNYTVFDRFWTNGQHSFAMIVTVPVI